MRYVFSEAIVTPEREHLERFVGILSCLISNFVIESYVFVAAYNQPNLVLGKRFRATYEIALRIYGIC